MKNVTITLGLIIGITWSCMSFASPNDSTLPAPLTDQASIQQVRERADQLEARRTKLVEELDYDNSAIKVLSEDVAFIEDYQNSDASSYKPRSIVEAEHPWAYASVVASSASGVGYGADFQLIPRAFSRFADSALVQFLDKYPILGKTVVRRSVWALAVPVAVYKVWTNFKHSEELQSFKGMGSDELDQNKQAEEAQLLHYREDQRLANQQLSALNDQLETLNGWIAVDQSPK